MTETIFRIIKENGVLVDELYNEPLQQLSDEELEQMMEKGEYIIKKSFEELKERHNEIR